MSLYAGQSRAALRQMYLEAWQRERAGLPLTPLQLQIATAVRDHPEYHSWLERDDAVLGEDFAPERGVSNPFLHLGMHLAIRDQIATDRPAGLRSAHSQLTQRLGEAHAAEHRIMEVLGEALWESQRSGKPPDEQRYLEQVQQLASRR